MNLLPLWYSDGLVALFGLLFGSFLNVIIYRVPAKISLMGRSYCPKCSHLIRGWHNIPVFAWFFLKGKCHDCKAPISWRYPAVEFIHAAAWVGIALWQGLHPISFLLMFFASISIALSLIDFDTLRLPDVITLFASIVTVVSFVGISLYEGSWTRFIHSLIGACIYGVFYFTMWFLTRGRGLGFGDVKLAPLLGFVAGWFSFSAVFIGIAGSFILGGIPAGLLLLFGILKRGTKIPFGPALISGVWVGIIWGRPLVEFYLKITHLK